MRAPRIETWILAAVVCGAFWQPAVAPAQHLVGIATEASAAELASAADVVLDAGGGARISLRSTAQVARMTDVQLRSLLTSADTLLLAGLFGEEATRVEAALRRASRPSTVVAVHGDARLLRHCRVSTTPAFDGLDGATIGKLLAGMDPSAAPATQSIPRARQAIARAKGYWQARGQANLVSLLRFLLSGADFRVSPPAPVADIRWLVDARPLAPSAVARSVDGQPAVALLDYHYGDREGDRQLHEALCRALSEHGMRCVTLLARWGDATVRALGKLTEAPLEDVQWAGLLVLQDFVLGGGAQRGAVDAALRELDVPVIKALRLSDRSRARWALSDDGLPADSVHYRLAMPEVQGIGQAAVVAAAGQSRVDPRTGLELSPLAVIDREVRALAARMARWLALRKKGNRDKRVAIVYYNHPPGRHNIGADNLDVPASLWSLLKALQRAGYDTGRLPAGQPELLELLQRRGVNLPQDAAAVGSMAAEVASVSAQAYGRHLESLPARLRSQVVEGPLAALSVRVEQALASGHVELAEVAVERVLGDATHLLEGVVHPARARALDLMAQLKRAYGTACGGDQGQLELIRELTEALRQTGIEGLRGWGPAPGTGLVHEGRLLVPGMTFGKVFVGPQPPRGWELNEELLHANLSFPPPHQYLAFYQYLREIFGADVLVHVGRHSTYEFLPGRRAGLGEDDFSRLLIGALPSVYLYIVDGVGEGIQAKRRGQAVIVDHLTPSLSTTPLYDELLGLRQLVESYESLHDHDGPAAALAVEKLRASIARLRLEQELELSMRPELQARGIAFGEADGELLVHEVGHYLTKLQERFMPHGLHVFGQAWAPPAVARMLRSMTQGGGVPAAARRNLRASPRREMQSLLAGLDGRFVVPGPGNDPIRTPAVLPTGRNFHALDASVLPTALAYELGAGLAKQARSSASTDSGGARAVVLWASDTVRDEGAMVAFGLATLGVEPVWNSRGIVQGVRRRPLEPDGVRRDTTFVTSGLFRDLYPDLMALLDRAVLSAIDGASQTIESQHPNLRPALQAALGVLGVQRDRGSETLARNQVAAHWVADAQAALAAGRSAAEAGRQAAFRLFGNAAGGYGAGINRLAERSGAWESRAELAQAYQHRLGHAYGQSAQGVPAHGAFARVLARVDDAYLGRASHLYGLLDNNDGFDYLGGLGLAVEHVRGEPPASHVIQHADPSAARLEPLPVALMQELRGRHLNPSYLKGLMPHGYAGARTMGSQFFENLWGWQVTSPQLIDSWMWDEVKAVYLDDKYEIGLDRFLEQGANVHVKTNMQAILLVAAHKGFWDVEPEVLAALSQDFARAVISHGLPGSGHTRPDHPALQAVLERLASPLRERFEATLAASLQPPPAADRAPTTLAEVSKVGERSQGAEQGSEATAPTAHEGRSSPALWWFVGIVLVLAGAGFVRGRRREGGAR